MDIRQLRLRNRRGRAVLQAEAAGRKRGVNRPQPIRAFRVAGLHFMGQAVLVGIEQQLLGQAGGPSAAAGFTTNSRSPAFTCCPLFTLMRVIS